MRLGPKLNDSCPHKEGIHTQTHTHTDTHTHTHTDESHVKMEAEIGMMPPQAKEGQ